MALIYLSSTYIDLIAYREAVYMSLRRLGYDVIAMEDYVTQDQRPLEKCLSDVASSDLYIGIVGWHYGYIPLINNPVHMSITELEYNKAIEMNKHCLIFMLDADAIWPTQAIDASSGQGDNGKYIQAFRRRLAVERIINFFRTPEELASLVAVSVRLWEVEKTTIPTPLESPFELERLRRPVKLFYSYSHRDEKLRERLDKQLSNLMLQGLITRWYDGQIVAGKEWSKEINDQMNAAQIILLLVSPDFMASNYCYGIEMKQALERHRAGNCCVIPIILRPSDWENSPFGKLQALPVYARAVTKWQNRDDAFLDIAKGIRKAIQELAN
jgi:hypothetical protein